MSINTPSQVLASFFSEMKSWERFAIDLNERHSIKLCDGTMSYDEFSAILFDKYQSILVCHTTLKPKKDDGLQYGDPPQYDPNSDSIVSESINGSKAEVITLSNSGMRHNKKTLYVLVLHDNIWKIDKRFGLSEDGEKTKLYL